MKSAFFPTGSGGQIIIDATTCREGAPSDAAGRAGSSGAAGARALVKPGAAWGLRFPSSRRYLWDRTPAGAQVLVSTQELVPRLSISASAVGALARAVVRGGAGRLTLRLSLTTTSTYQLVGLLQGADPLADATVSPGRRAGSECVQVPCTLLSREENAAAARRDGGIAGLTASLAARLDAPGSTQVAELFALSLYVARVADGRPVPSLTARLVAPGGGLLFTPLFAKRLCATPLAEALVQPGRVPPGRTGYLTMDQARSLLPLEGADDGAHTTPLVGLWVKGPESPLHPLVAAACIKFFYSTTLLDRALQGANNAFLLLLCPEGQPVSRCYEVTPTEPQALPLVSFSLAAELDPAAQLAQHPDGLIPLGWSADARPLPPLVLPHQQLQELQCNPVGLRLGSLPRDALALVQGGSSGPRASPERPTLAWTNARDRADATTGAIAATLLNGHHGSIALALAVRDGRAAARSPRGGSGGLAAAPAYGSTAFGKGGVDESQPRPSPRGLRPYGSPGAASEADMAGQREQSTDLPLCMAERGGVFAGGISLGLSGVTSPVRAFTLGHAHAGGNTDTLRSSLDTSRRAATAAAAALASAEAAVRGGDDSCDSSPQRSRIADTACADPLQWQRRYQRALDSGSLPDSYSGLPGCDPVWRSISVNGTPPPQALSEEVLRLRTELTRLQQLLRDATELPDRTAAPNQTGLQAAVASPQQLPHLHQQQQQHEAAFASPSSQTAPVPAVAVTLQHLLLPPQPVIQQHPQQQQVTPPQPLQQPEVQLRPPQPAAPQLYPSQRQPMVLPQVAQHPLRGASAAQIAAQSSPHLQPTAASGGPSTPTARQAASPLRQGSGRSPQHPAMVLEMPRVAGTHPSATVTDGPAVASLPSVVEPLPSSPHKATLPPAGVNQLQEERQQTQQEGVPAQKQQQRKEEETVVPPSQQQEQQQQPHCSQQAEASRCASPVEAAAGTTSGSSNHAVSIKVAAAPVSSTERASCTEAPPGVSAYLETPASAGAALPTGVAALFSSHSDSPFVNTASASVTASRLNTSPRPATNYGAGSPLRGSLASAGKPSAGERVVRTQYSPLSDGEGGEGCDGEVDDEEDDFETRLMAKYGLLPA